MLRYVHIPVLFVVMLPLSDSALGLDSASGQQAASCTTASCAPAWMWVALFGALAATIAVSLLAAYLFLQRRKLARAPSPTEEDIDEYREFFETAGDFAYTMDMDVCFARVNNALLQATGYRREELIGAHASKVLSPKDMDKAQKMRALRVSGQEAITRYEMEVTTKDGRQIPIELIGGVVFKNGQVTGTHGIARDITKRKRAEDDARRLREQLQMQIDRMPIGYIVWGEDFRVKAWNPAAEALFGYTALEALGKHPYDLIVPAQAKPAVDEIWRRLSEGDLTAYSTNENITRDGRTILCEWTNTPVTDPETGTMSVLSMVQDVTERASAQAALQEAKERAEEANAAKSTFLSNMSHEIRTPVSAIIGMSHLALKGERDPKQCEYLSNISLSGNHLLRVIDDILDFTKIEAGKLALETTNFSLDQIRQTVTNMVTWKAAEKGLKLSFDFDPDIPCALRGDPLRLDQILINYVNNAVKFTERGEIIIRARVEENNENGLLLRFEVQDTGIGISAGQQTKLFQDFQQADATMTRKYGGSGLGLVISKRLAELMGGAVGVTSETGIGSTFWFTARLAPGDGRPAHRELQEAARARALAAKAELKGARILLAEDHPFNQMIAKELLEDAEASVIVANNGKEALDLLHQERFDCILMDVQMPLVDGIEATRLMRKDAALPKIPVIALTANAFDADRERCIAVGMDDFIGKPFEPGNLYTTIAKWLPETTKK